MDESKCVDIFCVMARDSSVESFPPGMEPPQAILRRALTVKPREVTVLTTALRCPESDAQICP